jgi:hypothetical protein
MLKIVWRESCTLEILFIIENLSSFLTTSPMPLSLQQYNGCFPFILLYNIGDSRMGKMIKSFFHEGKLISIEVELKYSKIDKEELAKPQFLHRIRGYVNEQLIECIDTNNRSLEEQIEKMETICKSVKASIRRKMDAMVKRLIELGFK